MAEQVLDLFDLATRVVAKSGASAPQVVGSDTGQTRFFIGWSGRVDPDGNIYGFVSTPGTLNDAGFSNTKLDYILNSARKSVTQKSRITLYSAAMKIIHSQRPLIYLYHPVNYFGVTKKVTGIKVFGDGLIRAQFAGYAT